MKTLAALTLTSAALALALAGCGDSRATPAHVEPAPAAIYKAGHGLQFTETARKFAGLATGEVTSRAFAGASEVASIPTTALLRTVKGDFVYVVNGGWFLRTPVTTGASDSSHVEIKDGLYEGDTVVVRGVRALSLAEIQALNGGVGCAGGH
ncbi:MAG: hypothetical protein WC661_13705 [Opitutaceae bacterium]|jgi:hypothetical protein